jgi:hypothetical protein
MRSVVAFGVDATFLRQDQHSHRRTAVSLACANEKIHGLVSLAKFRHVGSIDLSTVVVGLRCANSTYEPGRDIDAGGISQYDSSTMTAIAKKLDARLSRWAPETAKEVKRLVAEIIELADNDALDLVRSREVEQQVLDIIDDRKAG